MFTFLSLILATLTIGSSLAHITGRAHTHIDDECHKPAPACFWGSSNIVTLQNLSTTIKTRPHDARDIAEFAQAISLDAEALVLILVNDSSFSTSSVASAASQKHIPNIVSADAMLPYVYPSERSLSDLMSYGCNESEMSMKHTSSANLIETLESENLLSNGKLDVVINKAVLATDVDEIVGSVINLLESTVSGKYVIILASDGTSDKCGRRRLIADHIQSRRLQEIVTIRSIKMTPCILTGLLFFFLFLFLLWVGLSCLGQISYPKEFVHPEQQPALGKEF